MGTRDYKKEMGELKWVKIVQGKEPSVLTNLESYWRLWNQASGECFHNIYQTV